MRKQRNKHDKFLEKELIQKSLGGDEAAFAILLGKSRPLIYRHCLSLVHDEESAEDLTQEACLQAFKGLNKFHQQSSFGTWLWRIAHNLSLNYLKKQRGDYSFNDAILPPNLSEKNEDQEELLSKILEAAEHLSSKHRVVFEMYDLQHIPQKEIAARLGITGSTVRSRLFYARRKIRELLMQRTASFFEESKVGFKADR